MLSVNRHIIHRLFATPMLTRSPVHQSYMSIVLRCRYRSSGLSYRLTTAPHRMKALVLASLDEFRRPLSRVSPTQSATLAATGLIWTRYCLVIRPVNYSLSVCNLSLGLANAAQCLRALRYQRAHRRPTLTPPLTPNADTRR